MNCRNTIIPEKIKRLSLLALACPLFFAACDLLPSPAEPSAAGAKTLVIRIGGAITDGRTALPPAVAEYRITVTREGEEDLTPKGGTPVNAGAESYSIALSRSPEEGDVVSVKAVDKDGAKIVEASATLTSANIPPNGAAVVITLAFSSEGKGSVNLSVKVPTLAGDDEITAVEVSLYRSLADYQHGSVYQFMRHRKVGGDYGAGKDLGTSIPIEFDNLPSGNYVVKIDFFRKFVRVSRLVQTIIVRDGLDTNRWDNGGGNLIWGEDKYASSNANLAGADGIKIGGGAVPDYNPATYTYAIYKSANSAETPALTIAGEPGQQIEAALNGNHVASGSALQLGLGVNSLVIAVTAPDGVTKQTYTVSYTYHYDTQWYVSENGDDDSGDGTTGLPYKTVGKALGEIETVYANASGWPGGASEPVTARINITGAIDESVDTTGKNLPPILLMGSESGADEINVESSLDKPVLTIDANTTVILGKGLTLTSNMEKRGVYVSGDFIMNGGTISENTGDYGGGVYVSGAAASFTMNGGTISENIGKFNGGGVYVSGGAFTMNGGTISGNSTNSNNFGGGVYVTSGSFTMNGGIISDNKADNGGGVYVTSNSAFTMNGGTISDNKADNGGGVCLKPNPDGNEKQNFTMNGGTISGNSATSMGGGVYAIGGISSNDTSHIIMEGGTVSGNTSSRDGGGVYVTYNNGIFTMKGGTISGNTSNSNISSNYGGGGVAVSEGGSFDMSGGTISGNSASNGFGGGVCVYGDNAVFTMHEGGIINGNTAKVGGGGVCVYGGNAVFTMHEGGIINGNSDNYSGGGVFVTSSATFIMSGGTISGNTGDYGGGVAVTNGASTFIMSGGTISGNSATSMGGGVYFLSGDSLIMSGGAVIHIDNPVYLSNNQVITLAAPPLTANPAANIEYPTASGTQVLADDISTVDNDITADGNYKKFWLNDASNEIDEDGKIK